MKDYKNINELIQVLKNYRYRTSEYCCPDCEEAALSALKYNFPVESLIIALRDKDPYIRVKVAEALGESEDPAAVEVLIAATKDNVYTVREAAAIALGEIKDCRAVDSLKALLENADEYKCVIDAATGALSEIKSAEKTGSGY